VAWGCTEASAATPIFSGCCHFTYANDLKTSIGGARQGWMKHSITSPPPVAIIVLMYVICDDITYSSGVFSLLRGPTLTNRLRATCMVRFPVFRGARRNRGQANPEREPGFARARIPLAPLSLRSPPYQRQRARVRTGGQRHRCWLASAESSRQGRRSPARRDRAAAGVGVRRGPGVRHVKYSVCFLVRAHA
jgi:hypothetical protein